MSDTIQCPHCNGQIETIPSRTDDAVSCPHCQGEFTVPSHQSSDAVNESQPIKFFRSLNNRQQAYLWAGVAVMSLFTFLVCGGMCGGILSFGGGADFVLDTSEKRGHLVDNPKEYAGKIITLTHVYSQQDQFSLREWRRVYKRVHGGAVYLVDFRCSSPSVEVRVSIPYELEVSDVSWSDRVSITFEFSGDFMSRDNKLIAIER